MSKKPRKPKGTPSVVTEKPLLYFASGASHPGEIRGFAAIGQPMGVAADECGGACERELAALAQSGIPVFVDSGAFGEIRFPAKGPPQVVKPISEQEWLRRLGLYERLAHVLGSQLYAVAPDRVGDQQETLARLRGYRRQIRSTRDRGAQILVPLQRGRLSLAQFQREAAKALGFDDFIPAVPMKKRATTAAELAEYLEQGCPSSLHLLGLGSKSPQAPKIVGMIQEHCPSTTLSLDSNKLKAYVGWEYGEYAKRMKKLGVEPMPKDEWTPRHHLLLPGYRTFKELSPRELTLAREFVGPLRPRFSIDVGLVRPEDLGLETWGIDVWDDVEMLARVDEWLDRPARKEILRQRKLTDLWEAYRFPKAVPGLRKKLKVKRLEKPPETPWLPNAEWFPAEYDDLKVSKHYLGVTPKQAVAEFLRSPSTWIERWAGSHGPTAARGGRHTAPQKTRGALEPSHKYPGPSELTDYQIKEWAAVLRPLYLDYLSRQKIDGATVGTAWRKAKAVQATFGTGDVRERFERWKQRMRTVSSQRDYEMALALSFEMSPHVLVSELDMETIQRGMEHPEYEEYRLRNWEKIPPWVHAQYEVTRAASRFKSMERRNRDPYYQWAQELLGRAARSFYDERDPRAKEVSRLLREVAEMRVAERKGLPTRTPPGVPDMAHAKRLRGYKPALAANPSPEFDAREYIQTLQARRTADLLRRRTPAGQTAHLRRRLIR